MTFEDIMLFLEEKGSEQTRKVLRRHGAKDPFFGVKVADLKIVQKKVKQDHGLALKLYETGNTDAMYLAALIADPQKFTKEALNQWVKAAYWYMLSDYAVAWVTAESPFATELANKWIQSDKEFVASAGWSAYASYFAIAPDEAINKTEVSKLMEHVESSIHQEKNRVRYAMNAFIIAAGAYIPELTEKAKKMGEKIGKVDVDMGGTACKVPSIKPYIEKIESKNSIGKKKRRAVC